MSKRMSKRMGRRMSKRMSKRIGKRMSKRIMKGGYEDVPLPLSRRQPSRPPPTPPQEDIDKVNAENEIKYAELEKTLTQGEQTQKKIDDDAEQELKQNFKLNDTSIDNYAKFFNKQKPRKTWKQYFFGFGGKSKNKRRQMKKRRSTKR